MQENEFSGTISILPFNTHVDKLVTSNFQTCFPAPYLSLHAKHSRMPSMRGSRNFRQGGGGGAGYRSV